MRIIAVVSRKGGSGKTTITAHIAAQAAQNGKNVAIADADPQGSLAGWWNDRESDDIQYLQATIAELSERRHELEESGIDYLIIDTPPAINDAIRQVVEMADFAVIPTKSSPLDIKGVVPTVDLLMEMEKPMSFVITQVINNAKITGDTAILLSQFGTVAPVQIVNRVDFPSSMIDGRTVLELNASGKSSFEIDKLWEYIESQIERRVKK